MPRNTDTSHLSRRAFISKTLLGSAGIICGASSQSQAFLGFSHAGQTLPEQWVAQQSNDTLKYANYINKKVELSRVSIPNFIESHFKSSACVCGDGPLGAALQLREVDSAVLVAIRQPRLSPRIRPRP